MSNDVSLHHIRMFWWLVTLHSSTLQHSLFLSMLWLQILDDVVNACASAPQVCSCWFGPYTARLHFVTVVGPSQDFFGFVLFPYCLIVFLCLQIFNVKL